MTHRKLIEQMIEALESSSGKTAEAAITAAREYLAAPEQSEPLTDGYVQRVPDKCDRIVWRNSYYHLPIRQPAPEPVAWLDPWTGKNATTDFDAYGKHGVPLYTAAPQPTAPEPVATAGAMPGTDGFTMAAFESVKVPVGTKLYTAAPQPTTPEPVNQMLLDIAYEVANAMPVNASQHIVRIGTVESARAAIAQAEQAPQPTELTGNDLWAVWDNYYAETPCYDRPSFDICLYQAMIEAAQKAKT